MSLVTILPTGSPLDPADRLRLEQACKQGYLIAPAFGDVLTCAYIDRAWKAGEPTVVLFPWRRYWFGGDITLGYGRFLTSEAMARLNKAAVAALAADFVRGVHFLPGGAVLRGLWPEAIESFAQTVSSVLRDSTQVVTDLRAYELDPTYS
jgi:hypothetical protein